MRPEERPADELLRLGCINLDKPSGPTSHQVTAWVKDIAGVAKAGHGGTLDPRVTGVLPVALNDAVRALDTLLVASKEYVGVMTLHSDADRRHLLRTIQCFVGEIYQTPPVRAAVRRQLRTRNIYGIEVLEVDARRVLFRVACEAGTYVRTLCTDIGEATGCGANLSDLRRTKAASFWEDDSVTLHELKDAFCAFRETGDEKPLRRCVMPMERLLGHLKKVTLKPTAVDAVCHGADLAVPGISSMDEGIRPCELVAMMTADGEGVALGKALMSGKEALGAQAGLAIDTERVLMTPGTYPKGWRTARVKDEG